MKKTVKRKAKKVVRKSISRKQPRGVSKVLVIGIVALILVGGVLAFRQFYGGALGGLSKVTANLNPNCTYNDPELCKFINNWEEVKEYSVTSIMIGAEEGTVESTFELSGEEKLHMTATQDGKEIYNMISIGDTTYIKDYTDNTWVKYAYKDDDLPAEDFQDSFDFEDDGDEEDEDERVTYKAMGKEACGNLTCFKYQIVDPEFSGTQYIWFDDREYRLRKQTIEDEGTSTEMTFVYTSITITEPAPIKEASSDMPGYRDMEVDIEDLMEEYKETETTIDSMNWEDTPTEE